MVIITQNNNNDTANNVINKIKLSSMYNVMAALRGCLAVKFNSCNNLLSSVHSAVLHCLLNENIIIILSLSF